MLMGVKILIQLNSGTIKMTRIKQKQCKRHCLNIYHLCPIILNSEDMDSKKNKLLFLMQIPVRNCGLHPKFSHDGFSLFFNFSSLSSLPTVRRTPCGEERKIFWIKKSPKGVG